MKNFGTLAVLFLIEKVGPQKKKEERRRKKKEEAIMPTIVVT